MNLQGKQNIEYEKNQIIEVICQLRFPTILSIGTSDPAQFQDLVRENLPRYAVREEKLPNSERKSVTHNFISGDGHYKLSLTNNFIALSTMRYTNWKDFAGWLDEPLGHFITVYRPAFFDRIGLRYINGFSRSALGLSGLPWRELITPQYLGLLVSGSVDEAAVTKSSCDTEMRLDAHCRMRLHAGPGIVSRSVSNESGVHKMQEKETRFIFDQDLYAQEKIPLQSAVEVLGNLHDHADRLFSGAITDRLHAAMEPVYCE